MTSSTYKGVSRRYVIVHLSRQIRGTHCNGNPLINPSVKNFSSGPPSNSLSHKGMFNEEVKGTSDQDLGTEKCWNPRWGKPHALSLNLLLQACI